MKILSQKFFGFSLFLCAVFLSLRNRAYGALVNCDGPRGKVCDFEAFGEMIVGVIKYVIVIGITFSAIGFAWAGFLYLTAAGDYGKVKQAHEVFKKIFIGFMIAISSFLIVDLIADSLGLSSQIRILFNSLIR